MTEPKQPEEEEVERTDPRWWDVLPGDYNELSRERAGERADAEAERRRREFYG